MAVGRNDIGLVRLLLSEMALINHPCPRTSALATAVTEGNIDMARFLLEEGADPDDAIALVEVTSKSPVFVHLLLEAFAKRYPRGKRGYGSPAVANAIAEDKLTMLEILLKSNADVSSLCGHPNICKAPLAYAIEKNNPAIVQRLIDRGLDLKVLLVASSNSRL